LKETEETLALKVAEDLSYQNELIEKLHLSWKLNYDSF